MSTAPRYPRQRLLACGLLAIYLPGCASWRAVGPSPTAVMERDNPRAIRVTRADGSHVELHLPSIQGDTLMGQTRRKVKGKVRDSLAAIPLSEVKTVAVRKFSPGRTVLFVGGVVGGIIAVWLLDCSANSEPSYSCP